MFGKKENVEVKTEEKKKSKKKTVLIVVVVLFLFLAIAGSDDNQSKNTVATSTNAVETENTTDNTVAEEEPDVMDGITEEDYIANNQERTDGGENQQPTTKDNKTTETTDKNNTNSNSLVEVSNVSPTGMRFKKTWSELKPQLDEFFANDVINWESGRIGENITEYDMIFRRYKNTTKELFNAFYIAFTVEDNTDKIDVIQLSINDDYMNESEESLKAWIIILNMFEEKALDVNTEFMKQVNKNDFSTNYTYRDGIYCYMNYTSPWQHYFVTACDEEGAKYHHNHNLTWKK